MNISRLAFAFALLISPFFVQASPSSDEECTAATFNTNCLNGVGPGVYGLDNARVSTTTLSNGTSAGSDESDGYAQTFGHSNLNGLPAGNGSSGWGIWGSFNYTHFDGDPALSAGGIARAIYDANSKSFMAGADKLFFNKLILGISAGYEDTEVSTSYNGGNNDSDGFTIAPYLAYLYNEHWSIDAAFGYSSLDYETDRISTANGSTVVGDFDSDRYFFSTNINASNNYDRWYLSGRVGYLYSKEDQDGYTELGSTARTISDRNLHISQIIVGAEAAYSFDLLEPYAGVSYVNDLSRGLARNAGGLPGGVLPKFDDDDEVQINLGVRHFGDGYSIILDYLQVAARESFDSHSVMLNFRADL